MVMSDEISSLTNNMKHVKFYKLKVQIHGTGNLPVKQLRSTNILPSVFIQTLTDFARAKFHAPIITTGSIKFANQN